MKIFLHILFTFIVCILAGTRRAHSHEKGSRTTALAQPFLHNPDQGVDTFKASMEEGNIQGVVNLLQNHIKQWSFIEAQLLEPNVNLGMPEIFIPLKHLTTTLQTLGSIFLMRDELQDAKSCFERACPLMELLPASLDDGFRADKLEAGLVEIYDDHGEGIQTSTLQKKGGFLGDEEPNGNYAVNCFSLLRKVYLKIYDSKLKKKGKEAFGIAHSAQLHPSDSPSIQQEPSSYATGRSVWEEQQLEEEEGDEYEDDLNQPSSTPSRSAPIEEVISEKTDEDGGENVDIEEMIEQLRLPFQHLRSELLFVRQTGKDNEELARDDSYIDSTEDVRVPFESKSRPNEWEGLRNALFPTPHIATSPASTPSSLLVDQESHEDDVVPMHPGANINGNTGSSTSIIATDLEIMLRKFVKEDPKGRQELLRLAAKYYDNLDINFPYMDYSEYAANMDIGMVYLDVMERVVREGFDFIGPELERWQDLGQALIMRSAHPSDTEEEEVKNPGTIGLGIVWELDPITGKKKEYTVELDGSYFDAFTLAERNRLLVLSAFDIAAHLQPTEQFDLSLGFSLGILDNDRSRQREATALAGALDGLSVIDRGQGKSASVKRRRTPVGKVDRVMAALYEEQTTPDLGGFSSLRAAVPTLTLEHWTTNLFLFFLIATVLGVAAASYVTSKRKVVSRLRSRGAKRSITSYEQLLHAINKCLGQSGEGDEEESVGDLMSSLMRSAVSALVAIPVQLWSQLRLSASVGLQTATITACSSSSSTIVSQTVTSGEKVEVDWTARLLSLIPISRSSTRNNSKADNTTTGSQSTSDKTRNADLVMLAMESCANIDEGVESAANCASSNLLNSIHSLSSDSGVQSSLSCSVSNTGGSMGSSSCPQPLSPPKPPSSPRSTQQKRNKDRKEQSSRAASGKDSSGAKKSQGGVISGKDRERESMLVVAPSEGAAFPPGAVSERTNQEWIWDITDMTKGAMEGDDEGWVEAGAKRKVANRLKQTQSSSDKTKGKISVQNAPPSSSSSVSVASTTVSKVAGGATSKKGSNSASGSSSRSKMPAIHSAEQPVSVLTPPTVSVSASAATSISTPATSGSGRAVALNLEERLLSTARTKVTTGRGQSNGSSSPNRPSYKIAVATNTSGASSTVTSSASSVSIPSPTTLPTLTASEEDFFALPPGLAVSSAPSIALPSIPEWIGSTSSTNAALLPPPGLEESSQQSLLYRLGLAALPSPQNCGQPPGLGLPLSSSSISGGHGIISTPLLSSLPLLDEMEQEMERDNLLQGILGDLLSPALDNHHDQDASNNNAAKQTTAYASPPGQIFPFSDLSPLAPVFEPNKGLSYSSQSNNTEEWVLNNMNL